MAAAEATPYATVGSVVHGGNAGAIPLPLVPYEVAAVLGSVGIHVEAERRNDPPKAPGPTAEPGQNNGRG